MYPEYEFGVIAGAMYETKEAVFGNIAALQIFFSAPAASHYIKR